MITKIENSHPPLQNTLEACISDNHEISMINVTTEDGFSLAHSSVLFIQHDKVAAMTSSLSSISCGATKMFGEDTYSICILEAEGFNIFFLKSTYDGKPCIISSYIDQEVMLGKARFIMKNLTTSIETL